MRQDQQGFTVVEVVLAVAVLATIVSAAATLSTVVLGAFQDRRVDSALWAMQRTTTANLVNEIAGADSLDPMFSVAQGQLVFREVVGVDGAGRRIFGSVISYELVVNNGSASLIRRELDATNTVLIGQQTVLADLTPPTDPNAPSGFTYASPFITLRLVARRTSASGQVQVAGTEERVRLRYE
ncbi:MAG: prepilin-type N-terminal cleavage/methylation domain-containing protein [Planctomycetota bacterium]|jgi:prepilin-type N-terminal cleavage/methylation domain-containing protein